MYARIRVHRIFENGEIEMHFEEIPPGEFPRVDFERGAEYFSSDMPEPARLEIGEGLAWSVPEPGTLLTMYVDTQFGFAGKKYESDFAVAEEMAKHVLLCTRGCEHARHTVLAML